MLFKKCVFDDRLRSGKALLVVATLTSVAMLGGISFCSAASPGAKVSFYVADINGSALNYRVDRFWHKGHNRSYHERFGQRLSAEGFPLGFYHYVLTPIAAGDGRIEGDVWIRHSEHWITATTEYVVHDGALFDGHRSPRERPLRGSVVNLPRWPETTWLRLVPSIRREAIEISIDQKGQFAFPNVDEGSYILAIIRGGIAVYAEPIRVPPVEPMEARPPLTVRYVEE